MKMILSHWQVSVHRRLVASLAIIPFLMTGCTWDSIEPDVCFEGKVLPIVVTYCTTSGCHNSIDRVEDYDFTTYNGIMQAVNPKRPFDSDLYEAMTESGDDHMPPAGSPQPSADQIDAIRAWIKSGAENSVNCSFNTCNTTGVISYSTTLVPMLQNNCIGCHSGGAASGGLDFTDFATFQQSAIDGRVQGAMSGASGYAVMPPAGNPLPACNVQQIDKWVAAGAPNN